jgi:hypothetical protein
MIYLAQPEGEVDMRESDGQGKGKSLLIQYFLNWRVDILL